MKINLNGGGEASPEDIAALEKIIGVPLDNEFLEFVKTHDGAEPDDNCFVINAEEGEDGIRSFIAVKDIPAEMEHMELRPGAYPVAYDSFGNYLVIDGGKSGAVYFWDHEEEEKLIKIASGFGNLLNKLKPDDISEKSIPHKVISVWHNPDADKILAKYSIKPRDNEPKKPSEK
jgi:hypothetical protein